MNDHDNIVRLLTQMEFLINQVQKLSDGTKNDILQLQNKADVLEKKCIILESEIKKINESSIERYTANSTRITSLESVNKSGVQRIESNRAYVWRKVFETSLPFIYIFVGAAMVWAVKNNLIK